MANAEILYWAAETIKLLTLIIAIALGKQVWGLVAAITIAGIQHYIIDEML